MLTRSQVQRYATESGLRDIMIAEKEIVLAYLLQLLSERQILARLAFKGGTCLRKMFVGSQGRFSTDLDFTGLEEHDHEDIIVAMMEAFDQLFHGIQFPASFPALGIPVQSGRDLQWTDTASTLVTNNLARQWYPDGNPLTHAVRRPRGSPLQIVGVVGDFAYNGPQLGSAAAVFPPCLEMTKPWPSSYVVTILVRSRRGLQDLAADVRTAVDRLGTHYLYDMGDEASFLEDSLQQERMLATISGAFGALAALLTDVGLYAFCVYLFVQRSRELAIRAALGASRTELATATVPEALRVLALGTGLGLVGAWALRHVLAQLIGNVAAPPLWQLSVALGIVVTIAAIATLVPAIRATPPNLARILQEG